MKSGIDLRHVDESVRPQDDLFRHVNGGWLSTAEIPADKARYGEFMRLRDEAEMHLRGIVDRLAAGSWEDGSDEQKIAGLYRDFMDTARVSALGTEPLAPLLARVDEVDGVESLVTVIGEFERRGTSGLFGSYVDTDRGDSSRYLVYLNQGGLGLPDESYYSDERFAQIRVDYVAHVQRLLDLAGVGGDSDAHQVMEVETRLATAHWDRVATRDATATYNLMTHADLTELAPAMPWRAWLAALGASESTLAEVVVRQPSFFAALSGELGDVDLAAWRAWLRWKVVHAAAPYLSEAFVEENFSFYGQTLSGVPQIRERWKRGVSLVESVLGEALGRLYVTEHFPPHAKARMQHLVANIVAAYQQRITDLAWMTPETRARALEKLAAFTPKIGYPDTWRDYSALTVVPGDLLGNVARAAAFETDRELAKIGSPVDRGEWFMTPQTVNAYYNPGLNEIVFPAAILQPPFFDADADDAANYGGIGAVIGHEIGHGFDDQGSKYDGVGNLNNWWTDHDRTAFDARAAALVKQYDVYEPANTPGHTVNGALTVGENIGDLGGLAIAAQAYRIALDGTTAPVLDGLSGMQRLMFGWAQVWREKSRSEEAIRLLATDPHSPPEFRCNGTVRNVVEFHDAFGTARGDALWMEPDSRVGIW
ncbi:MAG: M13-type metalloendopeptidase [Jiangellales bacterium]